MMPIFTSEYRAIASLFKPVKDVDGLFEYVLIVLQPNFKCKGISLTLTLMSVYNVKRISM